MTTRSYHDYLVKSLQNREEAIAYIDAVLEDGSVDELRLALQNIKEALKAG